MSSVKRLSWLSMVFGAALLTAACSSDDDPVDGADGTDGDGGEPTACEAFCTDALANCTGDNEIYASQSACETACAGFSAGTDGDTDGDTLACRAYHVDVAEGSPDAHCSHAAEVSVNADGTDGPCAEAAMATPCESFCTDAMANCTGDDAAYADWDTCITACGGFASGNEGDTDGDSLACRAYHVGVAAGAPEVHCSHAAEVSVNADGTDGPCTPAPSVCDTFCTDALADCTGGNVIYADWDTCIAACGAFDVLGTDGDTDGDTLQCRVYHLDVASGAPDAHCGHAGEFSLNADGTNGPCSDACTDFCTDAITTCVGGNTIYADMDTCMLACAAFDATGVEGATGGDTLQCRAYHVGVAADTSGEDTHCSHAGAVSLNGDGSAGPCQ